MARVSILLTSYNHIAFLEQAVRSVYGQTFTDWELIILDDGSTDGSREWLAEHAADARLYFSESNLGTYGLLNKGIELASGEFVAILNDDDLWMPEKLERQIALFDQHTKLGLVGALGHFIDDTGATVEGFLGDVFSPLEPGDALARLILANLFVTSSAVFRRDALGADTRFDPGFYGVGDYDLWLRIAESWWCAKAEGDLVAYRFHGAQASKQEAKMVAETQGIEERLYERRDELLKSRPGNSELIAALALLCSRVGTQRMWRGDRDGARRAYRSSLELAQDRAKTKLRLALTFLPPALFRLLR